jgi:hypothetical protein
MGGTWRIRRGCTHKNASSELANFPPFLMRNRPIFTPGAQNWAQEIKFTHVSK